MGGVATTARGEPAPGLASGALDRQCAKLRGEIVQPGDADYDTVRQLWNGMMDRRPAAILRCAGTADVVAALEFARGSGLPLAVRSGGHSIGGNSSCDGGLMIDLSLMKAIQIDAPGRAARAEAGVLLSGLDAATQAHGLAASSGVVGHTGIAGLTLGGGMGRLMRKYGLTSDTLLSAEVVLADGRVVTASETENPDLFWALRGGGGNFGIVTRFEYRLFLVGPTILGGLILHEFARATEALRFYRDFCLAAPDEVSVDAALMAMPGGSLMLGFAPCHIGPLEQAERELQPLRSFGPPAQDMVGPMPYVALQTSLDDLFARGRRFYWKSHFLREMPDAAIDTMVAQFARVPGPPSVIVLQQAGGETARRGAGETAYGNRDANWNFIPCAISEDPAEDARNIAWVRGVFEAMRPYATGGVYVNDLGDEGEERIRAAYGGNYDRLARVKSKYDPLNLFRLNQNIRPAT
jgi:FAD/FMN-containing dehydrogenase